MSRIAVMLSIHPKWVGKIVDGEKTIEIRKTKPKIETPFKCYIYHTFGGWEYRDHWCTAVMPPNGDLYDGSQKVIGEFICDEIKTYLPDDFVGAQDLNGTIREKPIDGEYGYWIPDQKQTCLTYCEILKYGDGKTLYGWHISNLKIYDEPKELSDFGLKRPPQSWCYVEEKE